MKKRKYEVQFSGVFKTNRKKLKHQPEKIRALDEVIALLACDEVLDKKYKDHALVGTYKGCRECHLGFDLVLVYRKENDILILQCIDVGSHTEVLDRKKSIKKKLR